MVVELTASDLVNSTPQTVTPNAVPEANTGFSPLPNAMQNNLNMVNNIVQNVNTLILNLKQLKTTATGETTVNSPQQPIGVPPDMVQSPTPATSPPQIENKQEPPKLDKPKEVSIKYDIIIPKLCEVLQEYKGFKIEKLIEMMNNQEKRKLVTDWLDENKHIFIEVK